MIQAPGRTVTSSTDRLLLALFICLIIPGKLCCPIKAIIYVGANYFVKSQQAQAAKTKAPKAKKAQKAQKAKAPKSRQPHEPQSPLI